MTLPSSGAISIQNLVTEFGGSAPHALTEYYRGAGLVPSTKSQLVTASSTSSSQSGTVVRGVFEVNPPTFNNTNSIMNYAIWADNGSTGSVNTSQVINVTGTYHIFLQAFQSTGDPGISCTHTVSVNGSQVITQTFTQSGSDPQTPNVTLTFSASSGATITTTSSFQSRGFAAAYQTLMGDNNSRSITVDANQNVPTSGTISLTDFYGTSA
jgi:hypothetical protein